MNCNPHCSRIVETRHATSNFIVYPIVEMRYATSLQKIFPNKICFNFYRYQNLNSDKILLHLQILNNFKMTLYEKLQPIMCKLGFLIKYAKNITKVGQVFKITNIKILNYV